MNFKVTVEKVTGDYFEFDEANIVVIFSKNYGKDLRSIFYKEYLSNKSFGSLVALNSSISKVFEETSSFGDLEIAAISLVGEIVYCAAIGGAKVSLVRGGVSVKIIESGKSNVISASGYIKEKDELILEISELNSVTIKFTRKESFFSIKPDSLTLVKGHRNLNPLIVGTTLLIFLAVSSYLGIQERNERVIRSKYVSRLSQAQHDLDEALELSKLNPSRARDLLNNAKKVSQELKNEGAKDLVLDNILSKINENTGLVLGEYTQSSNLFLDLSLVSRGFIPQEIFVSGEKMYVLDKDGQKLVSINLDTKKTEVIAGPQQISDAKAVSSYYDKVFILTDKAIYEVSDEPRLVIEKDWQGEVLLASYAGNIYLIEKEKGEIWRYSGIREVFGGKEKWLSSGINLNFSNASFVVIDGAIWILNENGEILKFVLGREQPFEVSGVSPPIFRPAAIYTNEEVENLYLLDPQNERIVVVDKLGNYKAQYFSDKVKQSKGLVVSEKYKKIIVMAEDKLYSIELKH